MPTIHCLCGYIGFGKTTIAKKLEQELKAKRFTPDELMVEIFGTDIKDDFMKKANEIDDIVWKRIEDTLGSGQDVIYDAGSWSKEDRKYVMKKANKLGANVIWHQILCDIKEAKKRTFSRSKEKSELTIDETFFDENIKRYQPIMKDENLDVVIHKN